MSSSKPIDAARLSQKVGGKYVLANALAKRAIQIETSARRRLEFGNRNPITRAIEELEEGAIEISAKVPVEE